MRILMGTVMAKLVVTSIVEESVHVELQAALFDVKQAVDRVRAASRLVPLARRRAPPRLAAARSTCFAAYYTVRSVCMTYVVGHSRGCLVGLSGVPNDRSEVLHSWSVTIHRLYLTYRNVKTRAEHVRSPGTVHTDEGKVWRNQPVICR